MVGGGHCPYSGGTKTDFCLYESFSAMRKHVKHFRKMLGVGEGILVALFLKSLLLNFENSHDHLHIFLPMFIYFLTAPTLGKNQIILQYYLPSFHHSFHGRSIYSYFIDVALDRVPFFALQNINILNRHFKFFCVTGCIFLS